MQKKTSFFLNLLILIFSALIITNSCGNRQDTVSCFPNSPISTILNLNEPYYVVNLQNGWSYTKGEPQTGTNGLIIYRASNGSFQAYDRNAPHLCPDANTVLKVVNSNKVVCTKDNAEWFLSNGSPISVAPIRLKTYVCSFDVSTNSLYIYN